MKIWKRDYYEKLLAEKPKTETVQQCQLQIQAIQRKIEELQSRCSHNSHEVVFYSWRPGAMSPSHVCTKCNKLIGSATEEESKALWDKFHKGTLSGVETTINMQDTVKK